MEKYMSNNNSTFFKVKIQKVLINDKLHKQSPDRALSVNVEVDKGFNSTEWEKMGL